MSVGPTGGQGEAPRAAAAASAAERWGAPWGGRQVVGGVGLVMVLAFVSVFVLAILARAGLSVGTLSRPWLAAVSTALLTAIFFCAAILMGPAQTRTRINALGFRPVQSPSAWLLPLIVLAGNIAFTALYVTIIGAFDLGALRPPDVSEVVFDGPSRSVSYLAIAILGPLGEEVFFRGLVFAGLVRPLGLRQAGLLSALLFGIAHFALGQTLGLVVPATFAGILFAWLYYRTGSIWPCVVAHAAQNGLAVLVQSGV